MNGDVEHPISFRFEPKVLGGHTHVEVWAGAAPPTGRGHCGTLVMRNEEWHVLQQLIEFHYDGDPPDEQKTLTRFEGVATTGWRPVYADDPAFVIGFG